MKSFQRELKLFRSHVSLKSWVHFPTVSDMQIRSLETTLRSESFVEVIKNIKKNLSTGL
jgi:hypothetical protein